jgi:hypothetical protein
VVNINSTNPNANKALQLFMPQTASILSIEAPINNAVTCANAINICGVVNDAVDGIRVTYCRMKISAKVDLSLH